MLWAREEKGKDEGKEAHEAETKIKADKGREAAREQRRLTDTGQRRKTDGKQRAEAGMGRDDTNILLRWNTADTCGPNHS